ncbi:MAG: FAD:protein FMN transferase [Candidatus Saccharibacteria bacterium]|nr:FAD:protein FMN transferase [Candidatus Saccharibacteria bacterium]
MHLVCLSETKLALGCDTTLTVAVDSQNSLVQTILDTLWLEIYKFEKSFSRFLSDSELSKFNRSAGNWVAISQEFKDLLLASNKMSELTHGLHNPFVLPALHRFGYNNNFIDRLKEDYVENYSAGQIVDYKNLEIHDEEAKIPKNTAIDMGGCGKGYLADKLAEIIDKYPVNGYWFSIGGDIIAKGLDENNEPWELTIQDANNPDINLDNSIKIDPKGLSVASSGTFIRKAKVGRNSWHHIIDPRTFKPAKSDILLATVVAPTTLQADVLATSAVILGSDNAKTLQSIKSTELLLQLNSKENNYSGYGSLYKSTVKNTRLNKVVA